jgi:hypothetical protein
MEKLRRSPAGEAPSWLLGAHLKLSKRTNNTDYPCGQAPCEAIDLPAEIPVRPAVLKSAAQAIDTIRVMRTLAFLKGVGK